MKVIVQVLPAIKDYDEVKQAVVDSGYEITEIVSGPNAMFHSLGELWAKEHEIPIKRFSGVWRHDSVIAGYMQFVVMSTYADALILITESQHTSANPMLKIAQMKQLPYHVHIVKNDWF